MSTSSGSPCCWSVAASDLADGVGAGEDVVDGGLLGMGSVGVVSVYAQILIC